jgi:hypothetical protein
MILQSKKAELPRDLEPPREAGKNKTMDAFESGSLALCSKPQLHGGLNIELN